MRPARRRVSALSMTKLTLIFVHLKHQVSRPFTHHSSASAAGRAPGKLVYRSEKMRENWVTRGNVDIGTVAAAAALDETIWLVLWRDKATVKVRGPDKG